MKNLKKKNTRKSGKIVYRLSFSSIAIAAGCYPCLWRIMVEVRFNAHHFLCVYIVLAQRYRYSENQNKGNSQWIQGPIYLFIYKVYGSYLQSNCICVTIHEQKSVLVLLLLIKFKSNKKNIKWGRRASKWADELLSEHMNTRYWFSFIENLSSSNLGITSK